MTRFELVDLLCLDIFDSISTVAPWSECDNIVALSIINVAHPWPICITIIIIIIISSSSLRILIVLTLAAAQYRQKYFALQEHLPEEQFDLHLLTISRMAFWAGRTSVVVGFSYPSICFSTHFAGDPAVDSA